MKNAAPGSTQLAILKNELRFHAAVTHHQGVVEFDRAFIQGEFLFVVLELCDGDMLDCIDRRTYVDRPALARQAFLELLDVVEHCHQTGIYHRDLKPQNVLCNSAGTGIPGRRGRGLCVETRASYSPRESDMWALGVIFIGLATTHVPWRSAEPSDPEYTAFCTDPNFLRKLLSLTQEANDLLRWCFHADPAQRPSIAQLRDAVLALKEAPFSPTVEKPTTTDVESHIPAGAVLISGLHAPSTETDSSADPSTPPSSGAQPPVAIVDLLDATNVGLAALYPDPLRPTKLHTPVVSPHLKNAPGFRVLDRQRPCAINRKYSGHKLRRV
ncbi:kinase-like domain-containing protein [Mycena epipterygia]|nr:kinase-like domain-containing protein [Mycena epipterygia]